MFNGIIERLTEFGPLVNLFAGLGLASVSGAVLLAVLKRNSQIRRWRNYKDDLERWAADMLDTHDRHPKELNEDDWRAECEMLLYDVQFTASEITEIMDLAIIVAKATTLDLLDTRT